MSYPIEQRKHIRWYPSPRAFTVKVGNNEHHLVNLSETGMAVSGFLSRPVNSHVTLIIRKVDTGQEWTVLAEIKFKDTVRGTGLMFLQEHLSAALISDLIASVKQADGVGIKKIENIVHVYGTLAFHVWQDLQQVYTPNIKLDLSQLTRVDYFGMGLLFSKLDKQVELLNVPLDVQKYLNRLGFPFKRA